MGNGRFTSADWAKLRTSRKIEEKTTNELFVRREMNPKFDPKYIGNRESRDSEEHPDSTPIIVGVDVTGSMGYLSTQIVKESLNELMQKLYSSPLVPDPQLLFAAVGDADVDDAPLQVTQFESDIRIAEQLLDLWLEGGGGDLPEDYELVWYFAARHTDTDSFRKRGKKGFCFTIGDASVHTKLSAEAIRKVFNDPADKDLKSTALAEEAGEKYELFHIVIGDGLDNLRHVIPGRVIHIHKTQVEYLPEILISVMQLTRGVSMKAVLGQWGDLAGSTVEAAVSSLVLPGKRGIRF